MTILAKATQLFADGGFDGTSIRDIAEAAGTSNATLYHYFEDKNAIYARVVIDLMQELCHFVEARIPADAPAPVQLRAFMNAYAAYFAANTAACTTSAQTFRALDTSPLRQTALYWRDRYESVLRKIIARGIERNELHAPDASMASMAVLSCLNWLSRWYSPSGRLRPEEIVATYADILLGGMAVRDKAPRPKPPPQRAPTRKNGKPS